MSSVSVLIGSLVQKVTVLLTLPGARRPARGVGVGLATMLVFYTFIFFNLLMVAIPRAAVRYGLALLLVLVVLVYFNPLHPVRALGFAALCGGLCLVAIVLTPWGTRLLQGVIRLQ